MHNEQDNPPSGLSPLRGHSARIEPLEPRVLFSGLPMLGAAELLVNGGFETGDNSNWNAWESRFTDGAAAPVYEGAWSLRLDVDTAGDVGGWRGTQAVSLTVGQEYTFHAYVRIDDISNAAGSNVGVEFKVRDAMWGNVIDSARYTVADGQWHHMIMTFTASFTGDHYVWFQPGIDNRQTTAYVDSLSVVAGDAGNTVPVSADASYAMTVNTPISDTLTGSDVDAMDVLTFATVAGPAHGTLTSFNAATGAFTYEPDADYMGADSFTFTVTDGGKTSAVHTVDLTVMAEREYLADGDFVDGAIAAADYVAGSTADDIWQTSTFARQADAGPTGAGDWAMQVTSAQAESRLIQGVAGRDAGTKMTLTMDSLLPVGATGTVSVYGLAAGQTISITSAGALEGTLLHSAALADNGAWTSLAGQSFMLDATYDRLVVLVQAGGDAGVLVDNISLAGPGNALPTVTGDSLVVLKDGWEDGTFTGSDVDAGDTLTYQIVDAPAHGTISNLDPAGGTYRYTPDAGYVGLDSFTFTAHDGTEQGAPATVSIWIGEYGNQIVNGGFETGDFTDWTIQFPGAESIIDTDSHSGVYAVRIDTQINSTRPQQIFQTVAGAEYTVTAWLKIEQEIGDDWGGFRVAATDKDTWDTLGAAGNLRQGSHGLDWFEASFTFTAVSSNSRVQLQLFSGAGLEMVTLFDDVFVMGAVNNPPQTEDDSYSVSRDGSLTVAAGSGVLANDTDPEGDSVSASLVSDVTHGTLTLNNDGSFQYDPDPGYVGADTFTYIASDQNDSNVTTVTIYTTVDDGNTPYGGVLTVDPVRIEAEEYDLGGEGISYHDLDAGNWWGEYRSDDVDIAANAGSSNGRHVGRFAQNEWLEYSFELSAGGTYDMSLVTASLADNMTLEILVDGALFDTAAVPNTTQWDNWQATTLHGLNMAAGVHTVRIARSDAVNESIVMDYFELIDRSGNTTPTGAVETYDLSMNTALSVPAGSGVLANDNDPDGDAVSAVLVSDVAHGTLTLNSDGSFDYTPDADFRGTDSFTYRPDDGYGGSDTVVTLRVNGPPSLSPAAWTVAEDAAAGAAVGQEAAVDPEAWNTLTYAIIGGNDAGIFTIDANTGAVTVDDPATLDFETTAQYTLTVQVSDGTFTDSAAMTVNVGDVNDNAPTLADATFNLDEDALNGAAVGTMTGADADTVGALTYSITAGNNDGAFAIDAATGAITVADRAALDPIHEPTRVLTVQVSDGVATDSATVTISLLHENIAPVLNLPADQETGGTLIFTAAAGNAITLTDVDAGDGVVELTMELSAGTLRLGSSAGLSFVEGAAEGGWRIVARGTVSAINVALNGLAVESTTASATLSVRVSDLGNTGLGDAGVAAGSVTIEYTGPDPSDDGAAEDTDGDPQPIPERDDPAPVPAPAPAPAPQPEPEPTPPIPPIPPLPPQPAPSPTPDVTPAPDPAPTPDETPPAEDDQTEATEDAAAAGDDDSNDAQRDADESPAEPAGPADDPSSNDSQSGTDASNASDAADSTAAMPAGSAAPSAAAGLAGGDTNVDVLAVASAEAARGAMDVQTQIEVHQLEQGQLWEQLNEFDGEIEQQEAQRARVESIRVGATASVMAISSAGYLFWCIRGGSLLVSVLASMPVWRWFDPLPVLEFHQGRGPKRSKNQTEPDGGEHELDELVD